MSEAMVKGAAVREFFLWYGEARGDDAVTRMVARAPEDCRALLDPEDPITKILPGSWYPCRLVHAMLDSVAEEVPRTALLPLLREANRAVVDKAARGVYRMFFRRLLTPEMYALAVPRFWNQLHNTGKRRMKVLSAGLAESVVSDWPGHHPLLCTLTIETMAAVFEHMGKVDVRWDRKACLSDGAPECVTHLRWSEPTK